MWRFSALERMLKPVNEERNRKVLETGSLQLYEMYFLQFFSLLSNCEKQYLNLELYEVIERFWRQSILSVCYGGTSTCMNEFHLQVFVEVDHQQEKRVFSQPTKYTTAEY